MTDTLEKGPVEPLLEGIRLGYPRALLCKKIIGFLVERFHVSAVDRAVVPVQSD